MISIATTRISPTACSPATVTTTTRAIMSRSIKPTPASRPRGELIVEADERELLEQQERRRGIAQRCDGAHEQASEGRIVAVWP
jgi:hypothetical protein